MYFILCILFYFMYFYFMYFFNLNAIFTIGKWYNEVIGNHK